MHYRKRPITVAVDPGSLVISECIAITSAIQKHARSPNSSVAAILGVNGPNPIVLRAPSSATLDIGRASVENRNVSGPTDLHFNRWGIGAGGGRSMQDNPLISGFGKLRRDISVTKDVSSFDALQLIEPFLNILQAKGTAAPVTTIAIEALRKLLVYGILSQSSPRFPLAMQSLAVSVTRCHFDGSDSDQVEVVLSTILHLMEDMMSGVGGEVLSDESVCEMMGRGLAICSQPRFSPVLRRTAETSMVHMCQILFEDLKYLKNDIDADTIYEPLGTGMQILQLDKQPDNSKRENTNNQLQTEELEGYSCVSDQQQISGNESHADVGRKSCGPTIGDRDWDLQSTHIGRLHSSKRLPHGQTSSDRCTHNENDNIYHVHTGDNKEHNILRIPNSIIEPYPLASVRELFRVLVNILDPHNSNHTDAMRAVSLRLIHASLEVAGPFIIKHHPLIILIQDRLCCYLFQLARSNNIAVIQGSLVVASVLLTTCRGDLKLQQELYIKYLITCLHPLAEIPNEPGIDRSLYSDIAQLPNQSKSPMPQISNVGLEGGSRNPDALQAMVEGIGVLVRIPFFMTELFINYDCDEDRADLCQEIIGLLARNALPDSATWSTTSVPPLCLDSLLRYINSIVTRIDAPDTGTDRNLTPPEDLRRRRRYKKLVVEGASKFNENPRSGLEYLHNKGVISDPDNPHSIALFLTRTSRISKRVLGEFLSKKGNESILESYMKNFDYTNKRVDEALRMVLETFRLPGEAPLISRIVTAFSETYAVAETAPGTADKDAVFILTYAIILLNTDQHNPNVKHQRRMKLEDFCRNLRGQNGGKDFDSEYLSGIFNSIKENEIILPDEHDNQDAFDYTWRELQSKTSKAGTIMTCHSSIYDHDMFVTTWRPIVSMLSYVFMSATDDAVFTHIIAGFDDCAHIAVKYHVTEAIDQIVYCLSHMTTLDTKTLFSTKLNTEVQTGKDSHVMVSELAVKLGRDVRAQLATLVLFRVVTGSESIIRLGWSHIIRIWLNLFVNSLIPSPFTSHEQSNLSRSYFDMAIDQIPLRTPSQVIERVPKSSESGFFSAFTSYISSYAADDPPEPSDEELESTLCTIDCIRSCHLPDIFSNILSLHHNTLVHIIDSLLGEIGEDGQAAIITVKEKGDSTGPECVQSRYNGNPNLGDPDYDPSLVYILEFCTIISCKDKETTKAIAKSTIATLIQILRSPARVHSMVAARSSFYALKMLFASHEFGYVNVPVLLHAIYNFPSDLLRKSHFFILHGIITCVKYPGSLRNELMTSPDFWAILQDFTHIDEAAPIVFDVIESSITDMPLAILAGNYEAVINLLNTFAVNASENNLSHSSSAITTNVKEKPIHIASPPTSHPRYAYSYSCPSHLLHIVYSHCGWSFNIHSASNTANRGLNAITMIHDIIQRVPQLIQQSQLENSEAWSTYWLPIFRLLSTQSISPCRELRSSAFSSLQRTLLSPSLVTVESNEWISVFGKVLFPLISTLLKPEIFSFHRDYMGELRIQSTSLLCKVFLRYLVNLSSWDEMLDIWYRIIDILDRLMNSGQGDSLEEAVRENLKNLVLFMTSNGFLASTSKNQSAQHMWQETWSRIDRFFPELKQDLAIEDMHSHSLEIITDLAAAE